MAYKKIPETWDGEADVVVVGAGNAGLPAAITATDKGDDVIVLEAWTSTASSLAYIAGGILFAGTPFQKDRGMDDSPEKMYNEAISVSKGDPELWGVLRDRELEIYHWLTGLGVELVGFSRFVSSVGFGLWWCRGLEVVPQCQRQGVGTALLVNGLNYLTQTGAKVLRSGTSSQNHASQATHIKAGFRLITDPGKDFFESDEVWRDDRCYYQWDAPVTE